MEKDIDIIKVEKKQENNIPTQKVKKGSKIGIFTFIIGCLFFIIFTIFGGIGILFYLAYNPDLIGTQVGGTKSTLQLLGGILFGFLIIISILFLFFSIIKIITSKAGKGKFILSSIFGFLILIFSIVTGGLYFVKVNQIPDDLVLSNNLFILEVDTGTESIDISKLGNFIVAPIYIKIFLNIKKLDVNITNINFNCGNGQVFNYQTIQRSNSKPLIGICYYTNKGIYNLGYEGITKDNKQIYNEIGNINIISEIIINNGNIRLNEFKDTIVLGNAPVEITYDATDVFNNYSNLLKEGKIEVDPIGNGKNIIKNKQIGNYKYENQGTYNLIVFFPEINYKQKIATLRVNQKDIPDCEIKISNKKSRYTIKINIPEDDINEVNANIDDISNPLNKISIETTKKNTFIAYLESGIYKFKADITLKNGRKVTCEKEIQNFEENEKLIIDLYDKNNKIGTYEIIDKQEISLNLEEIILKIDDNIINNTNLIELYNNNTEIPPLGKGKYKLKVENSLIKVVLTFKNGNKKEFSFIIKKEEEPIKINLKINPDYGYSPLTVTLDATDIKLKDQNDKVLYYTWELGDGQVFKNVANGKIVHTYKFDEENKNGTYEIKVTVTSKNGYKGTAVGKINVLAAPKEAKIICESHPTQTARVGDTITLRLDTSGKIKGITWDFGNGQTYSCEGRQCMTINTSYDTEGEYKINATIEYEDSPSQIVSLKIKIK